MLHIYGLALARLFVLYGVVRLQFRRESEQAHFRLRQLLIAKRDYVAKKMYRSSQHPLGGLCLGRHECVQLPVY